MTRPLFRPAAAADLEEAALWYEAKRPGLGHEFLGAAEDAVRQAIATPSGYAMVYKDRRRVLFARFPYSLVYRLIDEQVVVVAVVHAKRNPFACGSGAASSSANPRLCDREPVVPYGLIRGVRPTLNRRRR